MVVGVVIRFGTGCGDSGGSAHKVWYSGSDGNKVWDIEVVVVRFGTVKDYQ